MMTNPTTAEKDRREAELEARVDLINRYWPWRRRSALSRVSRAVAELADADDPDLRGLDRLLLLRLSELMLDLDEDGHIPAHVPLH
jgi:hypothetical protein